MKSLLKLFLISDPRVGEWFLMQSPVPIMILFVSYIFLVLVSPRVMKNVQPLNLKAVLIPYNFILVGLSIYMFLEVHVIFRLFFVFTPIRVVIL